MRTPMERRGGGGQSGGGLGCAFLLLAIALLGAGAVLGSRTVAAPALGAAPTGPSHGPNDLEIGAALAPRLVQALVLHPHALVVLSEQDLTVLARAHNPNPDRYRSPEVRVRAGRLVVSALSSVAGQQVTGVARLEVALQPSDGGAPGIATHLAEVDVGQVPIPEWARAALNLPDDRAVDPSAILQSNATLRRLAAYLDCVAVASDGLRMGFHRPGAAADPAGCDSTPGPA
ncbi:MAG: hypothetical protein ABR541_05255 [Candidatus Dormibacteria bacterium]